MQYTFATKKLQNVYEIDKSLSCFTWLLAGVAASIRAAL